MNYAETLAVSINSFKIKYINAVVFPHFAGFEDKNSIFKDFPQIIEVENSIQFVRFHIITFPDFVLWNNDRNDVKYENKLSESPTLDLIGQGS
jgi:hypothetical protein